MNVAEEVTRLRIAVTDAELGKELLPRLLAKLDTAKIITEWLDSGSGFRWEILAPAHVLTPILEEAKHFFQDRSPELGEFQVEENLTCISLAGGRPDSWLEVQRQIGEVLAGLQISTATLRADGSALRILVPGILPPDLQGRLHSILLET